MSGRLATPGALLMLAGVAVLYWGLGIFRGETSGGRKRLLVPGSVGTKPSATPDDGIGGGGGQRLQ